MRWNTGAEATVSGIRRIARNRQFENDRSPGSTIVKGVKRAMAGEYSREFSAKAFNGQSRLIELGFRQGGPAGYVWSFCALQPAVMDGAHQQRSQSQLAWARSSPAPAVGREIARVEAGGPHCRSAPTGIEGWCGTTRPRWLELNVCRLGSGMDRSDDGCDISCLRSVGRRNAMKPLHLGDSFAEGDAVGRIADRPKALLRPRITDE